jgi:FkbM family methyltransferase
MIYLLGDLANGGTFNANIISRGSGQRLPVSVNSSYGTSMLGQPMKAILLSAYQFRQIREMTATLAMPRRVAIASIARMNLLADRYLPNPVRLLGYKVSYADAGQLRDLFREIFVRTCYMFHTSERCPSIVDCGSNIGMSILFFKRLYPESRIIGFEPDPDTFAILQQNIEQNDLTDVIVHNCALSDHDGTIAFYQSNRTKSSLQMSIIPERGGDLRIDVPARRLSSFLTSDVDLLKMDIEGAETSVLPELANANVLRRIRQIHLEYHHHVRRDVDDLSHTLRLLEQNDFGYQLQAHSPNWSIGRQVQYMGIHAYRKLAVATQDRSVPQVREAMSATGGR